MHRRTRLGLAAIVVAAASVRFWGLAFGLPHTNTRPDEYFIIDVAQSFVRGNFLPKFYDYPWLLMWIVAGLYLLYYSLGRLTGAFQSVAQFLASWKFQWTPFFLIPRGLSAVMGTVTVLVVFRLARRAWGDVTGLVAALFMALAFIHVRDSHFGTTDITMTCLLIWSVSFLIDGHVSKRRRDFAIGGILGGLAAATKYNAALLIVPLVTSYLLNIFEHAPEERRQAMRDPRLFVYGLPFLAAFAVGVPFLLFDLPGFRSEMELLRQSMELGSGGLDLGAGWMHHLDFSLRYGLGLPLLAAALAGTVVTLWFEPRLGLLLFTFPISYFIVAGSVRNLFFRYVIPMVPFLCIAAARLVTRFVKRDALVAVVAALLVLPSAVSSIRFDRIVSQTDNRVVVARWFDEHVPAGDSVLLTGSRYGYVQFTRDRYKAWVWDAPRQMFVTDLDRKAAVGQPDWILVQNSPLPSETQPEAEEFLKSGYALIQNFRAFSPDDDRVYDQQDMFFAPFAGFGGVERPGPNFSLYKRSGI
ncbi:MAG TPA: glycosyltransferase family 39 protein [Vicinamibacterales bacterium]|nr:glycosyltransferase family 39 protein [Vicinamibacterales bacterium]